MKRPPPSSTRTYTLFHSTTLFRSPVADAADGVLQSSVRKSERLKVGRRHLAAPVDLQLEAEALTLVQALQPGPLDRRDMDECIGLAVIALNEADRKSTRLNSSH